MRKRYLLPIALWFVCYMALFVYLEIFPPDEAHMISCFLDEKIPYMPVFIYPYLSWFPYICVCAFLALKNLTDEDYKKSLFLLTMGMNIFLLVSYVWPTGLTLREGLGYDMGTVSGRLMKFVQGVDAPRSVFPSMHVYVTLVLQYMLEQQKGKLPAWGIWSGRLLAAAIVLSTMFTKQHSAVDVIGAAALFVALAAVPDRAIVRLCLLQKGRAGLDKQEKTG